MSHPHDFPFRGLGGDLEAIGKGLPLNDKGMVARRSKRIRHPLKQVAALVVNGGGFAVHDAVVHHDLGPESMPDTLVPQTHAEERCGRPESADDVVG
jgi:hypothetical protein